MNVMVEQERSLGNHPLQHANSVDDRTNRDPRQVAFRSGGVVVAVLADGVLERGAADQVSANLAVGDARILTRGNRAIPRW